MASGQIRSAGHPYALVNLMSLHLRNVIKTYREPDGNVLTVLDIEDFQIGRAEQMVLVGASGGGKTSLLNVISGISMPDRAASRSTESRSLGFLRWPATVFEPSASASCFKLLICCPPSPPWKMSFWA